MTVAIGILAALVLCAGVFAFLIAPGKAPGHGRFDGLYAHRGLHGKDAAENTLAAFERACRMNVGVELDLRLSADGAVVVYHDDSLERLCQRPELVSELTAEQLQQLNVAGCGQGVPLFSQVLAVIAGRAPIIIEIKTTQKREELCQKVCQCLQGYPGAYCVESFDPLMVRWFRRHRPEIFRGQLACKMGKDSGRSGLLRFGLRHLLTNFLGRPQFIAYRYEDRCSLSLWACKKIWKAKTAAWTVKNQEQLATKAFDLYIFEGFLPEHIQE